MKRRILVALLADDQEFQRLQAADAREAAARNNVEAEIIFADHNPVLQIQQLFKAIHASPEERPGAVVVETVTGEGLERVARNAVKAGVGWILINRRVAYLEDLIAQNPSVPLSSVGADQLEIGRIQGRQFRALLPQGGNLLYIEGPPDTSAARERLAGMKAAVAGSQINVTVATGMWTEESGERALASFLRLKTWQSFQPDVVGCQNDSMAIGAQRALRAFSASLGRVPVTGCDGLQNGGQRLVDVKQLAATVITRSNTGPAIDLLGQFLKTGLPLPPQVVLPATSYPSEAKLSPVR
jgi:ABC-type sugar transport system substrate-binding protein